MITGPCIRSLTPVRPCTDTLKWWCEQKCSFGHIHIHADTDNTHIPTHTCTLLTGSLWLSCSRWRGYCPRPACTQQLWQQARTSQHLCRPGPPDANLTSSHNTQPGTWAVNPARVVQLVKIMPIPGTFYSVSLLFHLAETYLTYFTFNSLTSFTQSAKWVNISFLLSYRSEPEIDFLNSGSLKIGH